jgi:hypothetical protein
MRRMRWALASTAVRHRAEWKTGEGASPWIGGLFIVMLVLIIVVVFMVAAEGRMA